MTHARNVWILIALEVVRLNTGWSREDVARYCYGDIAHRIIRSQLYGV